MIRLPRALAAWGTADFARVLKEEVEGLDAALLPLAAALERGSHVSSTRVGARVLHASATPAQVQVRLGLFFNSLIAGCACADDPTPEDELAEYCEVSLCIDRRTAAAELSLPTDSDHG